MTIKKQNQGNLENPAVDHPRHYNQSVASKSRPALMALGFTESELDNTECIAAMEDAFGPEALYWFCVMNGVKYLWRAGAKSSPQTDYQKARWYFDCAQQIEEVSVPSQDKQRVKQAIRFLP